MTATDFAVFYFDDDAPEAAKVRRGFLAVGPDDTMPVTPGEDD